VLRLLSAALRPFPLGRSLLFTLGPCDDPIFVRCFWYEVAAAGPSSGGKSSRQQTTGRVFHTARAWSRQRGGPSIPLWVLVTTVQGTQLYGWPPHCCDFPLLVLRHGSVAVSASLHRCWRPQCRGLSRMAGPLTVVIPAARAWSRQHSGPIIPAWVLATTV
jgi:hypothetical protein